MAQHDDHSSGRPAGGKPLASKTLHRTLQELESALADWDKMSDQPPTQHQAPSEPAKAQNPVDSEMRERTKKLLAELRKQLSEFSD